MYVLYEYVKQLQNFPYGNSSNTKIFLCGKEKYRRHATSFLNFSAPGHTTSPCINGYRDLVFYSITLMFALSREIILNILM